MRSKAIKTVIIGISLLVSGCGFQLNRNQTQLPDQASNLQVGEIINNSFRPGLNLKLEQLLSSHFSAKGIQLINSSYSDLLLNVILSSTKMTKSEHSLQSGTQIYLYSFSLSGSLYLRDNRNNSKIFNGSTLTSSYSLETTSADLTDIEIEAGFQKCLEDLSAKITTKITQTF